jgi:hypothetical protein
LLIEVAYFSAETEYTFSAHCIQCMPREVEQDGGDTKAR